MDNISRYHDGNPIHGQRYCIIINNTKKTFHTGYGLFYGGKKITQTRIFWLVDDCKKFGYKEI
jgi:hypothetical protein